MSKPSKHVAEIFFKFPRLYNLKTFIINFSSNLLRPLWARNFNYYEVEICSKIKPNEKILEIGCGSGRIYKRLRQSLIELRYVGTDYNEEMVEYCQNKYPEAQWLVLNEPPFHFSDKEFDIVVYCHVLHHIESTQKIAEILLETLRISKKVLIFEPLQSRNPAVRYLKKYYWRITDGGYYYFDLEEFHEFFRANGIKIISEKYSEPLHHLYMAELVL